MDSQRLRLQEIIEKEVFITKDQEKIVQPNGTRSTWLFDFRRVLLQAITLKLVNELFWDKCQKEYPFQIGGIEVAAIPLITGLVMGLSERGQIVNGFFIRKSRKKSGLLHMIEGTVTDEKIILVDDILNTGQSFIRQVEVIESLGKKVDMIFAILRFRDLEYYKYFHDKGIKIVSIFTLDDFTGALGVANLIDKKESAVPMPFKIEWYFKSEDPNYFYVIPKSVPVLDDNKLYFGSDNGTFWALNQSDGSISWKYRILGSGKKMIFSSPVLYKNMVYFGAYDGNFYALDTDTGKKRWIFMEADWIKSSPSIAPDLNLVFVGLEFGLWKKKGGLVALDAASGEKKWEFIIVERINSTPTYSKKNNLVFVSSNNSMMYALTASTGKLVWELKIEGEIHGSFAINEEENIVAASSSDGRVYILEIDTGNLVSKIEVGESLYSTPLISGEQLYVPSLDKCLYCFELSSGNLLWKFETKGRIFASPEIIEGKIYIGSNDGRLYELDVITGKNTSISQITERITNKIAYNSDTKTFFVSTFANEIYCLRRSQVK